MLAQSEFCRTQINIQSQFCNEIQIKTLIIFFNYMVAGKEEEDGKKKQFICLLDYYSRHSAGSPLTLGANALCRCIFICLTYRHASLMMRERPECNNAH